MAVSDISLSAWMYKLSGDNQRWQRRYFVLRGEVVQYYKLQSDVDHKKPRGAIDLTKGVGVRKRKHCHDDIVWPDAATEEASFGVATDSRTWYIYAESTSTAKSWFESLSQIVEKKGSPRDHTQDVRGKPKSKKSKIVRIVGQILGKGTQSLSDSGPIENDKVNSVMSTTGTVVEEQAEMDPRETSAKDRFRTVAGTTIEGTGEMTDNEVVGGVTDVVGNQIKAEEDSSLGDRLAILTGNTMATGSDMVMGPGGDTLTNIGDGLSEHSREVIEK